jgi:hypothetical protein
MDLIFHIEKSIADAENYKSKINNFCKDVQGMTGEKTRHFYNNICTLDNCRYLEIGVFKGSSSCSALYNNDITAVFIDNFQMSKPHNEEILVKNNFISNINNVKGKNEILFLEENCWNVDVEKLKKYKFNIYLYDGNHEVISQYNALKYYLPCLDDVFIFIVDDWNDNRAREGTLKAITDLKLEISYKKEILLTNDNSHTPAHIAKKDFWNGMAVFLLKKN